MLEESSILAESPPQGSDAMETDDMCWICLDDTKDRDPLVSPCRCPRKVHPRCLARWQLQQAGRLEETNCRFCQHNLADWKTSLTPENLKPDVQRVQPIMVVYFEGQIHRIPVKQGPDGLKEFTQRIRDLFRLPEDVDISLTFGCKEPLSGQHLKLEGIGAFDAAVHCASVAAAERQQKLKSGGGAASEGGAGDAAGDEAEGEGSAGGVAPMQLPASPNGGGLGDGGAEAAALPAGAPAGGSGMSMHPSLMLPHHGHGHGHYHPQQHQPLHYHYGQPGAGAAPGEPGHVSASAPASAQTSGGGSSDAVAPPTDAPLLHPAASAPALSLFNDQHAHQHAYGHHHHQQQPAYASHYHLPHHQPQQHPWAQQQQQQQQQGRASTPHAMLNDSTYPRWSSLSEDRVANARAGSGSGRTSSGGGAATGVASSGSGTSAASPMLPQPPPPLQSLAEFPPLAPVHAPPPMRGGVAASMAGRQPSMGSAAMAAAAAAAMGSHNSSATGLAPSPFQAAASVMGSRYADVALRSEAAAASGGAPAPPAPVLRQVDTCPAEQQQQHRHHQLTGAPPAPLADSISEPAPPCGSGFGGGCFQQPAAPVTPLGLSPSAAPASRTPAAGATSSFSPSALPPLPPSAAGSAGCAPPLTPRDHYDPCGAAAPPLPYHQQHERYPPPGLTDLCAASPSAAPGPATPARPVVRRSPNAAPMQLQRPPLPLPPPAHSTSSASSGSPSPSSPNSSAGRHHPYHATSSAAAHPHAYPLSPTSPAFASASASGEELMSRLQEGVGPLAAGMRLAHATSSLSGPAAAGGALASPSAGSGLNDAISGVANRRLRRTSSSSPRCEYGCEPGLGSALPSPSSAGAGGEDSAALGSLTGRLKFSLRAFSRKVARSLNFQRGSSSGSGGAGSSALSSPGGSAGTGAAGGGGGFVAMAEAAEASAEAASAMAVSEDGDRSARRLL